MVYQYFAVVVGGVGVIVSNVAEIPLRLRILWLCGFLQFHG